MTTNASDATSFTPLPYSLDRFAAIRTCMDLTFSPDGQWVAYVIDTTGQFNVWRQPVMPEPGDQPLMPVQLSVLAEEAVRRVVWSPDGSRLLAAVALHGSENHQLYEISPEQGWQRPLTNRSDVRHVLGLPYHTDGEPFSPNGRSFVYASNERDPGGFDALLHDFATGETRTLLAGEGRHYPMSWSPDGKTILILRDNLNIDQDLFLYDLASSQIIHLTPHTDEVKFMPGPWRPDGQGFYVMTDQDREYKGLAFFNVLQRSLEWIDTPEWDVDTIALSRNGQYLAWIINEDGFSRLRIRNQTTGAVREYPDLPRGVYYAWLGSGKIAPRFTPSGHLLGLFIVQATHPAELYLLDVESGHFWRLTQNFLGGVPRAARTEAEGIRYPSFDEQMVAAFLYRPTNVPEGARVPVVVSIHGGPESQEAGEYNGLYQYLLQRKIGILVPNVRGSTGYGKTYQKQIYRDWGGAELRDLEYAALYLRSLDWVDPERLGVMGASFGGFATLSCISRLPQYWAAAVDLFGPSDLITLAQSDPPYYQRRHKRWMGDPREDAELLRERSPMQYVEQIRAPLLVIQGADDGNVRRTESDQIVARLRTLGRMVEYLVFEGEGHGFDKTANQVKSLHAIVAWFERHLLRN